LPKHLPAEHNAKRRHCPLDGYGAHGKPGPLQWVEIINKRHSVEIPSICLEFMGIVLGSSWLFSADLDRIVLHSHCRRLEHGTE
jgi:hypothetical protein